MNEILQQNNESKQETPSHEVYNFDVHEGVQITQHNNPSKALNKTAKLASLCNMLADEEEDINVTSGCGIIKTQGSSISSKKPVASPPVLVMAKLKKRQRSRSNGSSSNGCESRSRSFGRATEEPSFPITPAKALKLFMNQLTDYEKGEILDYKQIYYLGIGASKIKGTPQQPYNFGYDDERGDYRVVLKDHICFRFEVIEFLGKGSFGQALKCFDHKTKELVAVKLIRNKKRFQHQAGVELKILMHLKQNDADDAFNIIRIKDYVVFRKHLVISFELFSINLYDFIKNNNFQGVTLSLIRRFAI